VGQLRIFGWFDLLLQSRVIQRYSLKKLEKPCLMIGMTEDSVELNAIVDSLKLLALQKEKARAGLIMSLCFSCFWQMITFVQNTEFMSRNISHKCKTGFL
jgi:hypothetical protein